MLVLPDGSRHEAGAPTGVAGATSTLTTPIGYYEATTGAPLNIKASNQFGGAAGTDYLTFGAQSGTSNPVTLQLNTSYNYFGFWWSAGDANNGLTFYSGTTLLARISTNDILSLLSPATGKVTAIDGTKYNKSAYYGLPNGGTPTQDTAEPFAYVSVLGIGSVFDRIVFDNSGSTASGFESDNHSVYTGSVTVPGPNVSVESIAVASTSVPEPESFALVGAGLLLAGTWRFKQRR